MNKLLSWLFEKANREALKTIEEAYAAELKEALWDNELFYELLQEETEKN